MDNNEIMNVEENEVMDDHIVIDDGQSFSTGAAMLIGAGLAFAIGAAVKFGKKAFSAIKTKVDQKKNEVESYEEVEDSEDEWSKCFSRE